jgi:prepilin-type N-terminal cleavage/methylation domain-containing protein
LAGLKVKQYNGFTLIELLVAITLLSMIMLLGTWSFSTFTTNWAGRLGYFSKHVAQSKDYILLSDIIQGISPHLINKNGSAYYYFEANNKTIKAVSQNGLFNTNIPVSLKLSVEVFSDGTQYLLYQEVAYQPFNVDQLLTYSHEKILINEVKNLQFSVFGWGSAYQKLISEDPLTNATNHKPTWQSQYNSAVSNLMPISIRIAWNDSFVDIPLTNDQGFWLSLIQSSSADE